MSMQPRLVLSLLVCLLATLTFATSRASAAVEFENSTQITIPKIGKATPYPSTIDVQGMTGRITDIAVNLRGLSHTRGGDVEIMVVAPDGTTSMLVSDACNGHYLAA